MGPAAASPINGPLDALIGVLVGANTAVPLIFGIVSSIAAIWQASTGESVSLSEMADKIEAQCRSNQAYGEAEIARLRALIST